MPDVIRAYMLRREKRSNEEVAEKTCRGKRRKKKKKKKKRKENEGVNAFPNRRPFITATECVIRHASRLLNGLFALPGDKLAPRSLFLSADSSSSRRPDSCFYGPSIFICLPNALTHE